jgi:O-antigen ligase
MLSDVLLASAILLSTASQLRPASLPVGPGELLLALWCGVTFIQEVVRAGPRPLNALSPFLVFWIIFTMAQSIGLLVGFSVETFRDTLAFLHDVIAYLLMAGMGCLILIRRHAGQQLRRTSWILVLAGTCCLILQVAAARGLVKLPMIEVWYFDRFKGWSENPNQMALLSCALVLVAVHLLDTATTLLERAVAVFCAGFCLVVGVMTRSDSFILFILTAVPLFIGLKMLHWLNLAGYSVSLRAAFAGLIVLAIPMAVFAAVPAAPLVATKFEQTVNKMMDDNNQAETRFKLWREAVEIGFKSWMLGYGPGPHLTSKDFKRPPPAKFEAHNTPLDLFTQGGALAVLSFVGLLAVTFVLTYRAGVHALSALVCALAVFSLFHLIVRQPIFWFSLTLCMATASSVQDVRRGRILAPAT